MGWFTFRNCRQCNDEAALAGELIFAQMKRIGILENSEEVKRARIKELEAALNEAKKDTSTQTSTLINERHELQGRVSELEARLEHIEGAAVSRVLVDIDGEKYPVDGAVATHIAELNDNQTALKTTLEMFLEVTDVPPDKHCTCHISPPCGDCVDNGYLRDAFELARAAIGSNGKAGA